MNEESDRQNHEQAGGRQDEEQQGGYGHSRDRDRVTHDPIIVDGGSFAFEFDGGATSHYFSATTGNDARFFGPGLHLTRVYVAINDAVVHTCPVPADGLFVVEVQGELGGHRDVSLRVLGLPGLGLPGTVEVQFKLGVFGTPSHAGNRKRCNHPNLTVAALTIKDLLGRTLHLCPAIPHDGRCRVVIEDSH